VSLYVTNEVKTIELYREKLGTEQSCRYIANVVTKRGRYKQVPLYFKREHVKVKKNVKFKYDP